MPEEGRMPEPPSDDEIEARLRRAREELRDLEKADLPDDEVDRQSQELQDRVGRLRQRSMPEVPEWNYSRKRVKAEDPASYRGLGVGFAVAYSMLGCVVAGWGLGKLIDMATGGVLGQAIGTLVGGIAGLASAIMMVTRQGDRDK